MLPKKERQMKICNKAKGTSKYTIYITLSSDLTPESFQMKLRDNLQGSDFVLRRDHEWAFIILSLLSPILANIINIKDDQIKIFLSLSGLHRASFFVHQLPRVTIGPTLYLSEGDITLSVSYKLNIQLFISQCRRPIACFVISPLLPK